MAERSFKLATSDGLELAVIETLPDGSAPYPVAVLVHGYFSGKNSNSNLALMSHLLESGVAVVRFDFRGHRDSDGKIEDVNISTGLKDLAVVMGYVRESEQFQQDSLGIVGNSYGGVVTELFAARNLYFKCVALKAPATDWAEARRKRFGDAVMQEWREKGVYNFPHDGQDIHTPYSFYEDIASYDVYREVTAIKCPVLVVHGDADESVPVEQSKRLVEVIGTKAQLHIYPGGDHKISNAFEEVTKEISEFLVGNLKSNG